ncbi:sugar kinase [Shewanella sp. 1_MG-2023]|uniref:sugar kinase n=1 Tax=unclassified Shewanella TaxID=196818 RepID=UPI0026E2C06C|nr:MULTISPECIES: sugar kinase [unclassified Shewanella]MDO6612291.1 sugar kinase [Shewanella sp. 7_MG-2023]MDO6772145.1 sugar kinase [Shewanella sp. 2_MG-2023]MDO6794051.1 sugar kinase [Shewanella sp. 1_MG-2023]
MKSILAIGECMMELSHHSDNLLKRSFAGDTYNALVYAKRYNKKLDCKYLTAIGEDAISGEMLNVLRQHDLNSQCVIASTNATIGIYAIHTDSNGERSFSYWRNQSAATQMMKLMSLEQMVSKIGHVDSVFFSGITLGILSDEDKHLLLSLINTLRENGSQIVFDPNYRPAMWRGTIHATQWINLAYGHSDIVLPGIEEHQTLFNHQSPIQIMQHCQDLNVKEIVVKCGELGTYVYQYGELIFHQPFIPAEQQVDSTAAGDSFAGTYLAARLSGFDIEGALIDAANIARQVVQHTGAIINQKNYQSVATLTSST